MTQSQIFDLRPGAPISVWINGSRNEALIMEISSNHALIELPEGIEVKDRGVIAILLREFVSLPMRIEIREGQMVSLSYLNKPHPSVLTLAMSKFLDESIAAAIPELRENSAENTLLKSLDLPPELSGLVQDAA